MVVLELAKMQRLSSLTCTAYRCLNRYRSSLAVHCIYDSNAEPSKIKLKHINTIHEYIGGDPERIKRALSRRLKLQLLDEEAIKRKLNILQEMNLEDQHTAKIINLLGFHDRVLKSRYQVLREYGVTPYKITSSHINKLFSLCKKPVKKLKQNDLIDKDFNVMENLWKAAGLDAKTCPNVSEDLSLFELKFIAAEAFFKRIIELPDEFFVANERFIISRFLNKSFATMWTNLNMFRNVMTLSKLRIQNNWFILLFDPSNTQKLLHDVKEVAGVDMRIVLHLYPKIAAMTAENCENIVKCIEDEGINIIHAQKCLEIFTLNSDTVKQRLSEINDSEYFSLHKKNPKILLIIYHHARAKKRLSILEEINMYPTINTLSATDEKFERIAENTKPEEALRKILDSDFSSDGDLSKDSFIKPESYCNDEIKSFSNDTVPYIITELDLAKDKFLHMLKRHHRWCYVPIIHVGRNLLKLRKTFSDEEIKKYIYILFYYSERLNKEMELLESRKGLENYKKNGSIKKEYILPMLLYFLEKDSNFSGESVWNEEEVNVYQDLPDLPVKRYNPSLTSA